MHTPKIYYQIICSLAAFAIGILLISFCSIDKENQGKAFIKNELLKSHKVFMELDAIAEMYQHNNAEIEDLRSATEKARLQFKRIEFYVTFYFPEYTKKHFNGAPLLRFEFGNSKSVVEPEGLQVLDELVYSEEAFENRYVIYGLAKQMQSSYFMLYDRISNKNVEDDDLLEAMRLQLVRIYTLGLTGFDTPGSLNGIKESQYALEGLKSYIVNSIFEERNTKAYHKCISFFDGAIKYLENNTDFQTFDRLEFLKKYLDPLYKNLRSFQIKKNKETATKYPSWNSNSESLFSKDFLNPYAFTELTEKEDSDVLKHLGEKLFYDTNISEDKSMSCATCHQPDKGFADGIPKSMSSINGQTVLRNAPTLLNAVYADRFFYDLRAYSLEQQAEHVIFNPAEFNTVYTDIIDKLNNDQEYKEDFKKLFGDNGIDRKNISKALASYVLSLQSFDSDFDKYIRGEINILPEDVKDGFNLFMGKANCATCHFAPTFSGLIPPFYNENESEILGVLENENGFVTDVDNDRGRIENGIYKEEVWIYDRSFKTTTVRNVIYTAPYFHNGAYKTLESVVDFYDLGGGAGIGAEVVNQTLPSDPLNLTDQEKKDLIAFMKALSDNPAKINNK